MEFCKLKLEPKLIFEDQEIHNFIVDDFINKNMDTEVYFPLSKELIYDLLTKIKEKANFESLGSNKYLFNIYQEALTDMFKSKKECVYHALKR